MKWFICLLVFYCLQDSIGDVILSHRITALEAACEAAP